METDQIKLAARAASSPAYGIPSFAEEAMSTPFVHASMIPTTLLPAS
jgi:hypothetical protein